MAEEVDTLIVGAGQAGLAMSHALSLRGREHLVLERSRIAERWRSERWDSLAFQFPNGSLRLPGVDHVDADPEGFAGHLQVTAYIEQYAATIHAPVRTGIEVHSLRHTGRGFEADTTGGVIVAQQVVLATGPFQRPWLPAVAQDIPLDLLQVHSSRYRNPAQLPPGAVLVVGSGGSGAQIAEELAGAGRTVYLALNRHRRVPRRRHGRDLLWCLLEMGWMDRPASALPEGRIPPTLLITGVDGGHDVDLHDLQDRGVVLLGRLRGADGCSLLLDDDSLATLAAADRDYLEVTTAIDDHARTAGLDLSDAPASPVPRPARAPATTIDIHAADITSVVWCTGYTLDHEWVQIPCFQRGVPLQVRGVSTHPGLYFLGLHWMHTFKSGTLFGIGDDAEHIAQHIQTTSTRLRTRGTR